MKFDFRNEPGLGPFDVEVRDAVTGEDLSGRMIVWADDEAGAFEEFVTDERGLVEVGSDLNARTRVVHRAIRVRRGPGIRSGTA